MMTTNQVSPGASVVAAPEVVERMAESATQNAGLELKITGTFHTTISNVAVEGDSATASVCDDFRDVVVADPNGTYTPVEVGLEDLAQRLTINRSGTGGWLVAVNDVVGQC